MKRIRTYFYEELLRKAMWLPTSFYMLVAIPIVLMLGLHMATLTDKPKQFAMVLACIFLFLGVVLLRAVLDVFDISRKHMRAHRNIYRETMGDINFLGELGRRVSENPDAEKEFSKG